MRELKQSIHGEWSSRWMFILAATGSAVGLGNIWRFPYVTGDNGGSAFVLVYLICVFAVGVPIMMGEILIGRRGRQSPVNSLRSVADEEGLSTHWKLLGYLGIGAGFIILAFYSVIAGWSLAYVFATRAGQLHRGNGRISDRLLRCLGRVARPACFLAHGIHDDVRLRRDARR